MAHIYFVFTYVTRILSNLFTVQPITTFERIHVIFRLIKYFNFVLMGKLFLFLCMNKWQRQRGFETTFAGALLLWGRPERYTQAVKKRLGDAQLNTSSSIATRISTDWDAPENRSWSLRSHNNNKYSHTMKGCEMCVYRHFIFLVLLWLVANHFQVEGVTCR